MFAPTTLDGALVDDLVTLAHDDLAAGHVLTSVAGFGPDLEINIALSSMGQDELGHARAYLVAALGPDRDVINDNIYLPRSQDYRAAPICWVAGESWERLVVKQYLIETADVHRRHTVASEAGGELAALVSRMDAEERYHVDFWTTWLERTAQLDDRAFGLVSGQVAQLWAATFDLFALNAFDLSAAAAGWRAEAEVFLASLGLEVPTGAAGELDEADRDRAVDELGYVRRGMPGRW